jgi:prepilin-type N-terminal cleavage/methylation domain-containing protein
MREQRAFTVIELLVVLAAVAVLLSLAAPRYIAHLERAQEAALKHNLKALREALDQYRADRGYAPAALQDLVSARYLREIPEDPITQSRTTWQLLNSVPGKNENLQQADARAGVGVLDVQSGAAGKASDGSDYASW